MILQKTLSLGQESGRELPTTQSTNRTLFFLGCDLLAVSLGATQQTRIFGYEKAFSFRVDSRHNVHAAIACMKIASLSLDPPILRHNRQTPSGLNGFLQAKSTDLGLLGHSDHVTV